MADAGPIRIEHGMARFPSSADAPPAGPCRQHAREPLLVEQQRQDRTILEQRAGRPPSCPSFLHRRSLSMDSRQLRNRTGRPEQVASTLSSLYNSDGRRTAAIWDFHWRAATGEFAIVVVNWRAAETTMADIVSSETVGNGRCHTRPQRLVWIRGEPRPEAPLVTQPLD